MAGTDGFRDFLRALDAHDGPIGLDALRAMLAALDLGRDDLGPAVGFDERAYRRATVRRRDHFQALVLCWKSGQASPVHDHRGSSCAVRVVAGTATETRFARTGCGLLAPVESIALPEGSVTGCEGSEIHQMANLGPAGSELVTLHVYSPPPTSWRSFRLAATTLGDNDRLIRTRPVTVRAGVDDPGGRAMTRPPTGATGPTVAIVGGGFSGVMTAVHLAREGEGTPRVLLFEKGERIARGPAYSTRCDRHLLNVPAGMMSALPDEPEHFLKWLVARDPSAGPGTFAPRRLYGEYLEDLLRDAASGGRIELIADEVVDLDADPDGERPVTLRAASGREFVADRAVLAMGNPPPADPTGADRTGGLPGYVAEPWGPSALAGLAVDATLALIGTGLTAIDIVLEAIDRGHRGPIVAISRHGFLPMPHRPAPPRPHFRMDGRPSTARSLLKAVRAEAKVAQAEGGDWRSVIDSIRPAAHDLWQSLGEDERKRFLRHLAPRWDVHRHRVAPQVDAAVRDALASGLLSVIPGRVRSVRASAGRIALEYRPRGGSSTATLLADRVVNCTGPSLLLEEGPPGLVRTILRRGIVRPGPLALGLDAGPTGALIAACGREHERLFAIGPLLRGRLWETTAVRELRQQSQALARIIAFPA